MTRDGGARPAPNRPATDLTVAQRKLVHAAARIIVRYLCPDLQPATDSEFDAFGLGYGLGVRDRHAQDAVNRISAPLDCEWPPVAKPGGGELQPCSRCARDAHEKCLDRRDEGDDAPVTCGCGCWTWAVTGE